MSRRVQYFRIARKFVAQDLEESERVIGSVVSHGAMHADQPGAFLQFLVGCLPDCFLQQRQRLGAVTALGEADGAFGRVRPTGASRGPIRSLGHRCPGYKIEEEPENRREAKCPPHQMIISGNRSADGLKPSPKTVSIAAIISSLCGVRIYA